MSGWTQPLCGVCWIAYDIGRGLADGREYLGAPTRATGAEQERCVICRQWTSLGIYIRISPKLVSEIHAIRSGSEP